MIILSFAASSVSNKHLKSGSSRAAVSPHFPLSSPVLLSPQLIRCLPSALSQQLPAKSRVSGGFQLSGSRYFAADTPKHTDQSVLMPYNRLIDAAGTTVNFGDADFENHSLDVQLITGTHFVVVEDRYGIAVIDTQKHRVNARYAFPADPLRKNLMSTYSGLKVLKEDGAIHIFWGAASEANKPSYVMEASFVPGKITILNAFLFKALNCPIALPNDIAVSTESGKKYLYVTLNGNNQLAKISLATGMRIYTLETGNAPYGLCLADNKVFVSNWAGPVPEYDTKIETAGLPYGNAYIDQATGAVLTGSVSVYNARTGKLVKEIITGLHPNAIISNAAETFVYVASANSDEVSAISTDKLTVTEHISVSLLSGDNKFIGDSPDALAINDEGTTLYVANGLDNAVAVISLGKHASDQGTNSSSLIQGFIPTEAYPGGLALDHNTLFVCNIEGTGANISNQTIAAEKRKPGAGPLEAPAIGIKAYNSHHQKASLSIIKIPDAAVLDEYTRRTLKLNFSFRQDLARLLPRPNQAPQPLPSRIGEPSVFKHVIYIIKENRTYDQVLGDMPEGKGAPELCIFGDKITPNQHQLARDFVLLDNYYASGKCSAEGHQWTDAGMVTDYIEKNVRAWFRSYPHVQNDALVYDSKGFIWNQAADHGKSVRIYGEASQPVLDYELSSQQIYDEYTQGKPLAFNNTSTISRVRPLLCPLYPGSDELKITDQIRADAFITELNEAASKPGDDFPELSVMALSADHTQGTRPGLPTPRAMVADNDLALGRIVEAVSKSRFWKNTVIFVTEDDSQAGWDHVSAYRTTGFVISPYSRLGHTISKNYNQVSMLRSIEQILGIPPMNIMDATAEPMFDCFMQNQSAQGFMHKAAQVSINERNPVITSLTGKARHYALESLKPEFNHLDGGSDELLNKIVWFSVKGNQPYPAKFAGHDTDD